MKVVEVEKALTVFDDYPDGVDVYYFYIQIYEEALMKYPKNKFILKEVDVDSL